ncbi:MAG: PqqD family peptide modification chaperone [Pseudomonadota bacterium]
MIGDEVVAFNCANQLIVVWNSTASELWRLMAKNKTQEDLEQYLINNYELSRSGANRDANIFLDETSRFGFCGDHEQVMPISTVTQEDGVNTLLTVEMHAIEKQIPFAVTFETTYSCNLNCIHCYMDRDLPSLSTNEICRILEEISEEGCLFLSLTGGEFFTRKDWPVIIDKASQLHFAIDILSNGTLINQEVVQVLMGKPIRRLQISLYGSSPETHDAITRVPGSFNTSINAINLLVNTGFKVEISCPLMNINFHERYKAKQLAENMGCLLLLSHLITAHNNGSKHTHCLRLDGLQLTDFLSDTNLIKLYGGRRPFQDHQYYIGFTDLMDATPCYSGINSCAISPIGKVLPCNQLLYRVGDLRVDSFATIWRDSPQLLYLRGLTLRDLHSCKECRLLPNCSRCPGLALLENNDLLGISPENCRVAKIQASLEKGGNKNL